VSIFWAQSIAMLGALPQRTSYSFTVAIALPAAIYLIEILAAAFPTRT
jgi:hypothetical protein